MARPTTGAGTRRRTTRPRIAEREAFEIALREIERLPHRAPEQNLAAEYLPRFIGKLRELGYTQDDIVRTIAGMNLGITERQIRSADSSWGKQNRKAAGGASGGSGGTPAGGNAGAVGAGSPAGAGTAGADGTPGSGAGARGGHAGLAGAGALKR